MKYRFHSEDKSAYHMYHPDGSRFKIAKVGLSPALKNKIKMYADGGDVKNEGMPGEDQDLSQAFTPQKNFMDSIQGPAPVPQGVPYGPSVPPGVTQTPTADTGGGMPGTQMSGDMLSQITGPMTAAYKHIGQVQQQGMANQAKFYQDYANQMQLEKDNVAAQMSHNQDDINGLQKEMLQHPIDASRYMNNMDSSKKTNTTIGLILGGMGAGLTGGANQALEMLKMHINNDIRAQEANMGVKQSMLSHYYQKFGNIQMARAATASQMAAGLSAHIAQAAAQDGSQTAIDNSKLAIAGVKQMELPYQIQLAQMQVKQRMYGGGLPEGQVPGFIRESKEGQNLVPYQGTEYQARSEKDAEELKNMQSLYEPIKNDVNLIKQIGTSGIYDPEARAQAQAAMNRLSMNVNEFNGYKRFTDTDKDTISKMFNDPSSLKSLLTGTGATADTMNALYNKLESEHSNRLIGYKRPMSFKKIGP